MSADYGSEPETKQEQVEISRPYWPFTRVYCMLVGHEWQDEPELDEVMAYCNQCGTITFRGANDA